MLLYCEGVYDITSEEYRMLYSWMPPDRQQRTLRYRRQEDRTLSVCAYGLFLYAQHHAGLSVQRVAFAMNPHGKPYLENTPFHFNLSHTENAVACAIETEPVGIDIQRRIQNYTPVLRRGCTDTEIAALLASSDPAGYFTALWTLKESYVKCRGTGIWDHLNQLDFSEVAGTTGTNLGHQFSCAQDGSLYLAACCGHHQVSICKIPFSNVLRYLQSNP